VRLTCPAIGQLPNPIPAELRAELAAITQQPSQHNRTRRIATNTASNFHPMPGGGHPAHPPTAVAAGGDYPANLAAESPPPTWRLPPPKPGRGQPSARRFVGVRARIRQAPQLATGRLQPIRARRCGGPRRIIAPPPVRQRRHPPATLPPPRPRYHLVRLPPGGPPRPLRAHFVPLSHIRKLSPGACCGLAGTGDVWPERVQLRLLVTACCIRADRPGSSILAGRC
jgi:hypothetical protein